METEEEVLLEELTRKEEMNECDYCTERDRKINQYCKGIEEEKVKECFKALERQKIVNGMQCTKKDEINLKKFHQLQIQEKRQIENENDKLELMWHRSLLDDIARKEGRELLESQRRHKEMLEIKRAYDEQISSATLKRKQAIQEERENETKRLETIKRKMAEDHYHAIKKKETQQALNRNNFIEGHQLKLSRLRNDRIKEIDIDNKCIRDALEELQREKDRKMMEMRNRQIENRIFTENYNREKEIAMGLEEEAERFANLLKKEVDTKSDEYARRLEKEKQNIKQTGLQDYKNHLDNLKEKMLKSKSERYETAENVKRNALKELKTKIEREDEEFKSQIQYRDTLTKQILDNQRYLKSELLDIESKYIPFTRRATLFKDVMEKKFNKYPTRMSTNPVHPFRRIIDGSKEANGPTQLPSI